MNRFVLYGWVLILLSGLSFCQPVDEDIKKKVVYKGPIAEARDILTLYSDSAKLKIKLTSPLQLQYESGDGVYPKGIDLVFYDENGGINNTLRANYGKYLRQKDMYIIRGNVILHNPNKDETLRTEELQWDRQTRKIFTDKFVTIQTKNDILKGYGMTSNQDFSNPKILKPTGFITLQQE
jgi:LPS export ABC transporter protein LptC